MVEAVRQDGLCVASFAIANVRRTNQTEDSEGREDGKLHPDETEAREPKVLNRMPTIVNNCLKTAGVFQQYVN